MNPLRPFLRTLAERAARSYVAGPHLSNAIDVATSLEHDGTTSTIAYWNHVGEEPAAVHAAYLAAIDGAADAGLRTYLSIKAPAIAMSESLADSVAQRCLDRNVGLHFDSLALQHQGRTFDLIERLGRTGVTLGCTLPARFGRSLRDVDRAVAGRWRARVVKGQWEDPQSATEPRLGFLALIDLLKGRAAHVAVATHEPRLAEEALLRLASSGTPSELELLFGLPMHAAAQVARRLNVPVRVYIPYGRGWLPYALSTARKNPRILRWLIEDAIRGRTAAARRRP